MKNSPYLDQVRLILRVLPHVLAERRFALKGGTAINLFVRDMPRMSIDVDLTWLPLQPRDMALENMGFALSGIADAIRTKLPGAMVRENRMRNASHIIRLIVGNAEATIKIEPNLVLRGTVFPCEKRVLCNAAEKMFELTTTAITVSMADLYAGKLCAALDRQHPRDIFDIKVLMENEGITQDIRTAFVVYLASHDRPMSELLDPTRKDFRQVYNREFTGLSARHVDYEELVNVRERVINTITETLTENERRFLLSIKKGQPNWGLVLIAGIGQLPAIRWKLLNIQKMNKAKHVRATEKLRMVLRL